MEFVEQENGSVLTLALKGRLDVSSSKAAEERILALIDAGEHRLVLDLAGLDYVSSIGLRVFMLVAKRLKSVDGRLALCALQPAIGKLIEIAGLEQVLRVFSTRKEAEEELAG